MKRKKIRKKRVIYFIAFTSIIVIIIIGLISYFSLGDVHLEIKEVGVNQAVKLSDIASCSSGELLDPDRIVDTSSLGKKDIEVQCKNSLGHVKTSSFELIVCDYTAPVISFSEELSTTVGTPIDLLANVTASDNVDLDVKVSVDGEYSFDQEGEYTLYYVAKDSSGNETKNKFILKVEEDNTMRTANGYSIVVENGVTYIDGVLMVNKTYSLPSSYGNGLTNEVSTAFQKMKNAATKDGITLSIISGYRSYSRQDTIYHNYVQRDGKSEADTYSARPGHSEHQSGLAFDLNSLESSFANTKEGKWLNEHAYQYGFILRYPKGKTNETGYVYEPWHFRYVGEELAKKLYNDGNWITLEAYFGVTSQYSE